MGEPARWFIGAATTTYLPETELDDRPELAGALHRMSNLFTSLGYKVVPGFGENLSVPEFTSRLRTFLTSPERRDDDLVVVYYTGHGALDERGGLLLPMADTGDDLAFTGLRAEDLTGRLLSGTKSVKVSVQRLLIMLDTCYAGAAGAPLAGEAVEYLNRLRGLTSNPSVGSRSRRPLQRAGCRLCVQRRVDRSRRPPRQRRPRA